MFDILNILCGVSCFGYFRGVVIVVFKLFNMVYFDDVFFGEKDF